MQINQVRLVLMELVENLHCQAMLNILYYSELMLKVGYFQTITNFLAWLGRAKFQLILPKLT